MREELGLERRHVDADGTVVRAALAGKTEIERLEHLLRAPELELLAVHHLPEDVRASARRVLLLARDHVARAHHAAIGTPALPDTDAAQCSVLEAAVILGEREVRLHPRRRVARPQS